MLNRSRTVLAGIGATAALAWVPMAVAQGLVMAPASPAAPAKVIVVEPSDNALRSTGMKKHDRAAKAAPSERVVATDRQVVTTPGGPVVSERQVVVDSDRATRVSLDAAGFAAGHIQQNVARVEPPPQGNGLAGTTPLRLADGSRVIVPWPMSATGRNGERVNVNYTTSDTGERIATQFSFDSQDEAP